MLRGTPCGDEATDREAVPGGEHLVVGARSYALRTRREQTIIARGPYRTIRHPGYLGSILVWTGSRVAVNWLIALITAVLLLVVYRYRISAEEHMLEEHFGEAYRSYKTRTWRLVPLFW